MRRPWAAPVAALAVAALAAAAAAHAPPPLELPASVAAELADEERRRESSSRHACFRAAYDDVASGGCRNLDDEGKMRLAFYFARCQLEATGRDASAAPCESTEAVAECGRRLNAEGYSEFGAWFRHVDTLCFALESRRWREDTSRIVASLVSAGDDTVKVLGRVIDASEDLREKNVAALEESLRASAVSATLLQQIGSMQSGITEYQASVQQTIADTQSSYSAVADVLRQLSLYTSAILSLQGVFARNLIVAQSLVFYTFAGAVAWALTGSARTAGARLSLFVALLVTFFAEVFVLTRWSTIAAIVAASAALHAEDGGAGMAGGGALGVGAGGPQLIGAGAGAPAAPACPTWAFLVPSALCAFVASLGRARTWASAGAWVLRVVWGWVTGDAASGAAAAATPAHFLRLSFDPLSLERWDASTVSWTLRGLFVAYALVTLTRHALAYTDFGPANFNLLTEVRSEVRRLRASSDAEAARRFMLPLGLVPAAAVAALGGDTDEGGGGGGDDGSDDPAADPDYEPSHDDDGATAAPLAAPRRVYDLRPRPLGPRVANPVTAWERPEQFATLCRLQWMASRAAREEAQEEDEEEVGEDGEWAEGAAAPPAVRAYLDRDGGDVADWSDSEASDVDDDEGETGAGAAMDIVVGGASPPGVAAYAGARVSGAKRPRAGADAAAAGGDAGGVLAALASPKRPRASPEAAAAGGGGGGVPARRRSRGGLW